MNESAGFRIYPRKLIAEQADTSKIHVEGGKGLSQNMFMFYLSSMLLLASVVTYLITDSIFFLSRNNVNLWSILVGVTFGLAFALYMNVKAKAKDRQELLIEKRKRHEMDVQRRNESSRTAAENEAAGVSEGLRKSYDEASALLKEIYLSLDRSIDCLDGASREYEDNAFGPFWDAVEHTTLQLDKYRQGANQLAERVREYNNKLSDREHNFPPYPVLNGHIPDASAVLEDLRRVVRLGQTNFQFANIWEHRRTRDVMIKGFLNLEEAVNNLGAIVESSISYLQESISHDIGKLGAELSAGREEAAASNAALRDAVSGQTRMQAQQSVGLTTELRNMKQGLDGRLSEHSVMLDNIRRDRKPGILAKDHGRDR